MISSKRDLQRLSDSSLRDWVPYIEAGLAHPSNHRHGQAGDWDLLLNMLPEATPSCYELEQCVRVGCAADLSSVNLTALTRLLHQFHPWRKGPFELFGIHIDTEWRSDWKWQRLLQAGICVTDKNVLDIGCGNGYHLWRMYGAGARNVVGIDPSQLFLAQFSVFKHYLSETPVHLFPMGLEHLPTHLAGSGFDCVFCMGVLYHRRSPIDTLIQLRTLICPGGELILETLVIEGDEQQILLPEARYAQMKNVWFLPSVDGLSRWLQRAGFTAIEILHVGRTTTAEQRPTPWMKFQSLCHFLDPGDPSRTIEGYPAPTRAIVKARPRL